MTSESRMGQWLGRTFGLSDGRVLLCLSSLTPNDLSEAYVHLPLLKRFHGLDRDVFQLMSE